MCLQLHVAVEDKENSNKNASEVRIRTMQTVWSTQLKKGVDLA